MAIWQVTFALVPEMHFGADATVSDEKLNGMLEGDSPAYAGFSLPDDYVADATRMLPPNIGWSEHMEHWGDEKSDDFTIWRSEDDKDIEIIEARVDVRKLDDELLAGILDLARRWKCVLVEKSHYTVCRMKVKELRGLIAGHSHSRATKDPATWLPFLSEKLTDDPPELSG